MNAPETLNAACEAIEGNQAYPAVPAEPIGAEAGAVPAATLNDEPQLAAVLVTTEPTPEEERAAIDRLLADAALLYPEYAAPDMTPEEAIAAVKSTNVHIAHIAIVLATPVEDAILYYRNEGQAAQTVVPHDVVLDLIDDLVDEMHDPIIVKLHAELAEGYIDGLYVTTPTTLAALFGNTIEIAGQNITLDADNLLVVLDDPELIEAMIDNSQVDFDETPFGTRLSGYDLFAHFAPAEAEEQPIDQCEGSETATVEHEGSEI